MTKILGLIGTTLLLASSASAEVLGPAIHTDDAAAIRTLWLARYRAMGDLGPCRSIPRDACQRRHAKASAEYQAAGQAMNTAIREAAERSGLGVEWTEYDADVDLGHFVRVRGVK